MSNIRVFARVDGNMVSTYKIDVSELRETADGRWFGDAVPVAAPPLRRPYFSHQGPAFHMKAGSRESLINKIGAGQSDLEDAMARRWSGEYQGHRVTVEPDGTVHGASMLTEHAKAFLRHQAGL